PTVGSGNPRTVEAYIMDFNDDLYGADIKVEFMERIRDERKFDSMEALRYQISVDELFVRNYFKGHNL
ncbi:MAG TPA: riboflavin kinase, partial [Candidatus Coprenecus stercoripullorum]|nr:riboflavin kinase [Candidatus Coprenecus stercoripullorum]